MRLRGLGEALRAHPLRLGLPVQAALLLTDLGHLPAWGDEHQSLLRAVMPLDELVRRLHENVHPPLYALLLGTWLELPWDAAQIVRARAFSVLCVLLATIALDRCWLRACDARTRAWFILLWTVSPAVLLYGRMARSYGLQLLLATLALAAGQGVLRQPSIRTVVFYAATATALLYTHYLPGIAVMTAVGILALLPALRARRPAALIALFAPPVIVGLAYLPWLSTFTVAFGRVSHAAPYRLAGNSLVDGAVSVGYMFVAFTFGESLPPWLLIAAAIVTPAVVWTTLRGASAPPEWFWLAASAAIVAYVGATRWVTFPFVAARLFFLLPFYLLFLVHGAHSVPRARPRLLAAMACMGVAGIAAYFSGAGMLNKAYGLPYGEIARSVRERSTGPPIVILDHHSTSLVPVTADLPATSHWLLVHDTQSAAEALRLIDRIQPTQALWFAHSTHDTSPDGWNRQIEVALQRRFDIRRELFGPYSSVDHWLMRGAGWAQMPSHAIELLEMRPHGGTVASTAWPQR